MTFGLIQTFPKISWSIWSYRKCEEHRKAAERTKIVLRAEKQSLEQSNRRRCPEKIGWGRGQAGVKFIARPAHLHVGRNIPCWGLWVGTHTSAPVPPTFRRTPCFMWWVSAATGFPFLYPRLTCVMGAGGLCKMV